MSLVKNLLRLEWFSVMCRTREVSGFNNIWLCSKLFISTSHTSGIKCIRDEAGKCYRRVFAMLIIFSVELKRKFIKDAGYLSCDKDLMDRYDISLYMWNLLELIQLAGVKILMLSGWECLGFKAVLMIIEVYFDDIHIFYQNLWCWIRKSHEENGGSFVWSLFLCW